MCQSYMDDCWIVFAKAIMNSFAKDYSELFPRYAKTQEEYTAEDLIEYQRRRESLILQVTTGPLRYVSDPISVRSNFDKLRETKKLEANVHWRG